MKKLNFYLSIFLLLSLFSLDSISETINRKRMSELKQNLNSVDVARIKVTDFSWKNNSKYTLGLFEYVEIQNNSDFDYKDIVLEISVYTADGTLTLLTVPIQGELRAEEKKRFIEIQTPILSFSPDKTFINVVSANLIESEEIFSLKAKNVVDILDFDYVVDNTTTNTIIVNKLTLINRSENSFEELEGTFNFLDKNRKIIKSVRFSLRGVIGAKETKVFKDFNISGAQIDFFSDISYGVSNGKLINPREYLDKGGSKDYVSKNSEFESFSDSPVPNLDLIIKDFVITNQIKSTVGLVDIYLSNTSHYKYKDIVISVGYKNSFGTTLTSKKIKIKDLIQPYSDKNFKSNSLGMIELDFDKLSLSVVSAKMVGEVKPRKKTKFKEESFSTSKGLVKRMNLEKEKVPDIDSKIIVVESDIKELGSIKLLNTTNYEIFDLILKVDMYDDENSLFKTYEFKVDGSVAPGRETTFRSINFNDSDLQQYVNSEIKIISGKKAKN